MPLRKWKSTKLHRINFEGSDSDPLGDWIWAMIILYGKKIRTCIFFKKRGNGFRTYYQSKQKVAYRCLQF